jgi:PAS domain S-box-containing protein
VSFRAIEPDLSADPAAADFGSARPSLPPPPRQAPSSGRGRTGGSGEDALQMLSRTAFLVLMAALAAAAALALLLPDLRPDLARLQTAGAYLLLSLLAAGAWRVPRRHLGLALTALLTATWLAVAAAAGVHGLGLSSPALGIAPLLVVVLSTAVSLRAGLWMAAVATAALGALYVWGPDHTGGLALQALATHGLLLLTGLAVGAMTASVLRRHMAVGTEREHRFRGLLAVAVDGYWEIDASYRLTTATWHDAESRQLEAEGGLGRRPWELHRFACEPELLDRVLADLDTRVPFRDVPVRWTTRDGSVRLLNLSGEPRFDERGLFIGYWGVARDTTEEAAAREALHTTETLYEELFARTPTPLLLHRHGRILDANPAALRLLGCANLAAMRGRHLLDWFAAGDSRERAERRLEALSNQQPGTGLPVEDFALLVDGRRLAVRASGVRVRSGPSTATLTMFIDVTARRAAEQAVKTHETLLSNLVETSPDLITLTDADTGRYAMVNKAFERISGWTVKEAVGRSSLELGIWEHPADRERFVSALREHGTIGNLAVNFVSRAGQRIPMLVSAARFQLDHREYFVVNARDISETERARLEREAILDNASIGIAVTRDRRFVLANPAFERIFGWEPGSLIGQPGRVAWPSAEDYAEISALAGPVFARGEPFELEREAVRRDGSTFTARVRGHAIDPKRPTEAGAVWIVDDVTERREFESALARARDAAEAASRAKSAFLANTSHELRTPLNGMIGMAQLARAPDVPEAKRRLYLDQIAESAQALAGIISDILDLSKIEAGKLPIESTAFDLAELLQALQRSYATLATARHLKLVFEVDPEVGGLVAGDPLRVRQILTNYLSNALKFTAQGEVRLTARRIAERVRLEVSDTGVGIDDETQSRLFRPFTQADESTTRRFGGTGLGLSICRELALLMHGEVGVDSRPGTGSRFWAELPLPPAEQPSDPIPADAEHRLAGARVLLVEDNPVNMMIATAMLERWGVQVEPAHDGQQAVEAVHRAASVGQDFDAILMDVQMPVMSGHEATRVLRCSAVGARVPIIALTAAALVTERQEALEAGMNDFLTKPIDADRLRRTLSRWLGATQSAASD